MAEHWIWHLYCHLTHEVRWAFQAISGPSNDPILSVTSRPVESILTGLWPTLKIFNDWGDDSLDVTAANQSLRQTWGLPLSRPAIKSRNRNSAGSILAKREMQIVMTQYRIPPPPTARLSTPRVYELERTLYPTAIMLL